LKLKSKYLLVRSLLIVLIPLCLLGSVIAENDSTQYNVGEKNLSVGVERKISFLSGGYIMINDTFILSWNMSESEFTQTSMSVVGIIGGYTVGLPRNYSDILVYYSARDAKGDLPIKVLEDDENFLWLGIIFSEPIMLANSGTYNFTVTYVFSELVRSESKSVFHAIFPLYPSLREEAIYCNVTVIFPPASSVSQNDYPREVFINKTSDHRIINNFTSPLTPYANFSSWAKFSSTTFKLLKFLEMRREILVDVWGKITVTDFYEIMPMINVGDITLNLPAGASDISVYDAYGQYGKNEIYVMEKDDFTSIEVTLGEKIKESRGGRLAVSYTLPFWRYIIRGGWQDYILNINITKPDEWIIKKMTITVILPEGAGFVQENRENITFSRLGLFQEKMVVEYYRVTRYQRLNLSVKYQYMILWATLRPTLSISVLAGIISLAVVTAKYVGGGRAATSTLVPMETIRKFIESYEERMRLMSEIEYLEEQSRKGKISRRQYMLQRRLLEERLSNTQNSIATLRREIEAIGGRYMDMLRRLEAASANIMALKRSIAEVEARYARGEISAESRRNLINEYERRRKEAENMIDDTLLRLKEEIM